MHTCFYVKLRERRFENNGNLREKGGFLAFNSVSDDFSAAVRENGKLFDKISLLLGSNGETEAIADCEFVSARAVSDNIAELCFRSEFVFESETVLYSASFVSEGGKKINSAAFPSGVTGEGKTEIFAKAYIGSDGNIHSSGDGFCDLLCFVAGVKNVEITADFANLVSGCPDGSLSVSIEKTEDGIIFSVTPNGETSAKYLIVYADGRPAFYVEAGASAVFTEVVSTSENVIAPSSFYKEISLIADSAVNLSDVKTRTVALSVGGKAKIHFPFGIGSSPCAVTSSDLKSMAILCEKGVVCYKNGGEFFPVNPFSNIAADASQNGFCYSGEYLYVLDDGLKKVDPNTLKTVKSYALSFAAEKIFELSEGVLIFLGKSGFTVAEVGDEVSVRYSESVSGEKYAFDKITSVLTVFSAGGIKQYSVGGTACSLIGSYAGAISLTDEARVAGRYKKAFLSVGGVVRTFDLIKNAASNEYFSYSNEIVPDSAGTYFAVCGVGDTEIFRYDDSFVPIGKITGKAIAVTENGIVSDDGFYRFGETANRFEILSSPATGNYTICKEVPYFEDESVVFTVKGVV